MNTLECITGIGFLTGHYTAANDCYRARDWVANIDKEIDELLGSSESDGLVAKESQFYPKTFYNPATGKHEEVHSNVLGDIDGRGYREVGKNHKDIYCDETFKNFVYPMLVQSELSF